MGNKWATQMMKFVWIPGKPKRGMCKLWIRIMCFWPASLHLAIHIWSHMFLVWLVIYSSMYYRYCNLQE